jgi:hypothetical protein
LTHPESEYFLKETEDRLKKFNGISLNEIGSVSLMNRIEFKYIFMARKLVDILSLLPDDYNVLEIKNIRCLPYTSTYLDTSESLFYNEHIHGKLNRYKIRYRKYETTGESFLEIKKKTNTGRTVKRRIENSGEADSMNVDAVNFINKLSTVNPSDLDPVLCNSFNRITLANFDRKERITIDLNIKFGDPDCKGAISLPYLAIAELKKDSSSGSSPFRLIAKQLRIYPSSFSKYCVGRALMNTSLRSNILKPKILLINKFKNEYTRYSVTA